MRPSVMVVAFAAMALASCGQGAQKSGGAGGAAPAAGGPRQQVWAAGSSTVFPFATRVAENVARSTGGQAAKVESLGTGGGIKLFCTGPGSAYPDIATASRRMTKSEFDDCAKSGVADIVELKIGFDGIVLGAGKTEPDMALTTDELYRALAAELPAGQGFAANAAKTWKDIDPTLPATRIVIYGPPPTSGTRDAFVELALEAGAAKNPAMAALKSSDGDAFKARAHTIRTDGAWIDSGENDNAIVQTLTKTPGSIGVFGYSFLENNRDAVKGLTVNGVTPSRAAITSGQYPLSRSLYIYVKKANIGVTPGLREYVTAFLSDASAGEGGYLSERGLISLPQAEHVAEKAKAADLPAMPAPQS